MERPQISGFLAAVAIAALVLGACSGGARPRVESEPADAAALPAGFAETEPNSESPTSTTSTPPSAPPVTPRSTTPSRPPAEPDLVVDEATSPAGSGVAGLPLR